MNLKSARPGAALAVPLRGWTSRVRHGSLLGRQKTFNNFFKSRVKGRAVDELRPVAGRVALKPLETSQIRILRLAYGEDIRSIPTFASISVPQFDWKGRIKLLRVFGLAERLFVDADFPSAPTDAPGQEP